MHSAASSLCSTSRCLSRAVSFLEHSFASAATLRKAPWQSSRNLKVQTSQDSNAFKDACRRAMTRCRLGKDQLFSDICSESSCSTQMLPRSLVGTGKTWRRAIHASSQTPAAMLREANISAAYLVGILFQQGCRVCIAVDCHFEGALFNSNLEALRQLKNGLQLQQ